MSTETNWIELVNELDTIAQQLKTTLQQRDTAITNARHAGIPIRTIAAYLQVSPQTVLNIINRMTTA